MDPQDSVPPVCPGTSLATGADVAHSPVFRPASQEAAWRRQRDLFFVREARKTSRTTNGLGVLVQLVTFGLMIHGDYPTWRVATLGGVYLAFVGSHRAIMRCTLDPSRVASAFILMSVSAQVYVVASAALTGGVHSIFIPITVMPAIVSLLFFGPQAVARWVALANALLLVAMVSLPASVTGPALPDPHYAIGLLISLIWFLFMLHLLVGKLAVVASRAGESVACLREERLSDAEAQLRRLQSVGAKVAHELKNPLASIKGLCQLVARSPEGARTQERLTVVASEISRMETILHEYLSFSRPLEDIKPETIDLSALARDVLDVLDGRAVGAGVSLDLDGAAPAVQGDPRRLKEALINLVANAIEATPSGGAVELRVRGGRGSVELEVQDSGRGIAPEDLERLGTSFFTTRANGTGLGVVLAQGVIAQHGGTLAYKSALGKGTTATITLPLQAAPRQEPAPRAAMLEARA